MNEKASTCSQRYCYFSRCCASSGFPFLIEGTQRKERAIQAWKGVGQCCSRKTRFLPSFHSLLEKLWRACLPRREMLDDVPFRNLVSHKIEWSRILHWTARKPLLVESRIFDWIKVLNKYLQCRHLQQLPRFKSTAILCRGTVKSVPGIEKKSWATFRWEALDRDVTPRTRCRCRRLAPWLTRPSEIPGRPSRWLLNCSFLTNQQRNGTEVTGHRTRSDECAPTLLGPMQIRLPIVVVRSDDHFLKVRLGRSIVL